MATATQIMQISTLATHTQSSVTTAPVREHACLFTHDLRRKQKRWQDGRLKYHTFNRRVMVYDERGNFVGDTHWREDDDLADGDDLELERGGVIIQVGECVGSRDQDLSDLIDKRAQERAQRQAAAAARRPPVTTVATLHAVKPQSLPQKHLHDIIGTPSGHHGRAVLPKESPYEERRQRQPPPQSDDSRPAKRQRRDISPPSKSGYAQNLFGATLTLSGRLSSQVPAHNRSQRISLPANDAQLSTKTLAGLHSSIRPEPTVCANRDMLNEPGTSPTRKQRPKLMLNREEEIRSGRSSVLYSQSANQNSRKHREMNKAPEQADLRVGRSREPPPLGGPQNIHNKNRLGAGNDCTQARKPQDLDIIDLTEDLAGTSKRPVHREPRTELRIKPRKKRGLLMISERDTISGSSLEHELANTGSDGHERSLSPKAGPVSISSDKKGEKTRSTNTQHTGSKFSKEARNIVPQRKKMKGNNGNQEGGHSDSRSSCIDSTRHLEDEELDESQHLDGLNPESWKRTKPRSSIKQCDAYTTDTDTTESRKYLKRVKRPPTEDTVSSSSADKDHGRLQSLRGGDNAAADEMPAPCLAKLGRKSVKSKEVIGFVFDDEPGPILSVRQNEHIQEEHSLDFQPAPDICKQQRQFSSKVYDNLVMTEERLDAEPRSLRERSQVIQGQKSRQSQLPNNQAGLTIQTKEALSTMTATTTKQLKLPISNPATRGKKAAKPSDAAGQMPICPLPAEPLKSSLLHQHPGKMNGQENKDKGAAGLMPGFCKANGGPWSREAHDLFDFKRPS
ncbi:hypothetical protein F5Y12DRAFT_755164 [Xylaria sp. FL1777]|nr:hypothetical protein F5Y12DRAFT_755164 [Xylaria sp. FL1777]